KIGTEGTYSPFTYHDESVKLVCFDVEIGEAIAAKLVVKAEFVEGKWDGLIAGLYAKLYDTVINQFIILSILGRLLSDGDSW
ncbi:transporter substrate-binding domain-containing protein, partial [Rhizobium leguminosarum]|uniref:transporter substrate-binding domain-containing protein n=1 Tax=Rhizobium leguminosarum TaxID=384 RepID=UPI003F9B1735